MTHVSPYFPHIVAPHGTDNIAHDVATKIKTRAYDNMVRYMTWSADKNSIAHNSQVAPYLIIIQTSDDKASASYIKGKINDCKQVGLSCLVVHVHYNPEKSQQNNVEFLKNVIRGTGDCTYNSCVSYDNYVAIWVYTNSAPYVQHCLTHEWNYGDTISAGVILQLPLAQEYQGYEQELLDSIPPELDVDGLSSESMASLLSFNNKTLSDDKFYLPCTMEAVVDILHEWSLRTGYTMDGAIATVIGRGHTAGQLLPLILSKKYNMSVHVAHSHTDIETLELMCRNCDIIISAVGSPHLINPNTWFNHKNPKRTPFIIDIGMSATGVSSTGKTILKGDYDPYEQLHEETHGVPYTPLYTPVPRGMGLMTRAKLVEHCVSTLMYDMKYDTYGRDDSVGLQN